MTPEELRARIRESGKHNRCDLSRLLADPKAFAAAVSAMAAPFRDDRVQLVAAIESMALPLGGAVALQLSAGLVMLRKADKVAWTVRRVAYLDYKGEKGWLEVAADAFGPGDRVVIVDDWTETGGQLRAAVELVESMVAQVVGISVLNADHAVRESVFFRKYRLHSVFSYTV